MMGSPADVTGRWQEAWNAGDARALAALFDEEAEFVNVVGLWWHTRAEIEQAHAYGFAQIFPGSTMRMSNERLRYLGAEAAVVHAKWRIEGQVDPGGQGARARTGIFTFVLARRPGGWIVVAAQNTDIVPGAETHVNVNGGRDAVTYRRGR